MLQMDADVRELSEANAVGEKSQNRRLVDPAHDDLLYCGRIDDTDPHRPVFVQPGSFVRMTFSGSSRVQALVINHRRWNDSWVGVLIDDVQKRVRIDQDDAPVTLTLAEDLDKDLKHQITFFKRMDQCHEYTFLGFLLDDGAKVLKSRSLPRKKIEFYGDSLTAGECSEAIEAGRGPDPEQNGEFNNSYFSFAWATTRRLYAQAHFVAHGGIAMMDGLGHMDTGDGVRGMESCYDKVYFFPDDRQQGPQQAEDAGTEVVPARMEHWNFARYTPQVVVVAVGQNDAYPDDFMRRDFHAERGNQWREHYKNWILSLREVYPNAWIVLMTSIKEHDPAWDRSIGRVCAEINDPRIVHFLFEENGRGTPSHIRASDAMSMALELAGFIESLSDRLWD